MTHRDPDMIRVSARHLRRLLGSWGPACSLEEARQWLGHSSLSVTTRYAHLSPKGYERRRTRCARRCRQQRPMAGKVVSDG